MQLRITLVGLALAIATGFSSQACAQVRKCVDAQGNVKYTDSPCPSTDAEQSYRVQSSRPATAATKGGGEPGDMTAQQMSAELEARKEQARRKAQAECDRGDAKACAKAVCVDVVGPNVTARNIRDCSTAEGLKATAAWAQRNPLERNGEGQRVRITCLTPQVHTAGNTQLKTWTHLQIVAESYATSGHERGRFHVDETGGPDYATWEEAADAACR